MQLSILENYKAVGKIAGNGDAFSNGHVKHFDFDNIDALNKLLVVVGKNPRLCNVIGKFPRNGKVLPADQASVGDMTRTKSVVNTGDILVIDNDFGSDYERTIIGDYWETFDKASHIITRSGSTISGKKKHGSHTYYILKDGNRNLSKALEFLEAIYICEGVYDVEFYKTGKAVVKTPIDKALSQSSRVVYEDEDKPKVVKYKGGSDFIDISTFPDRYEKVMQRAKKIKEKALAKVEKKSLKLHAEYVLNTTGKKLKGKEAKVYSLQNYDKHEVDENFVLYLNSKKVGTIGDLILGKIDEVYFQDLYEPDYGGGSQKAKYYADTRTFFSQAHGGITYKVVLSDKFNGELIDEFLKDVPFLADARNVEPQLLEMSKERNIVDRKRMVRDYAKNNGVTSTDVEKELTRINKLTEEFDKFYDLWLRGEYESTVNVDNRLENYIKYKETANMVNTGGKVVMVDTYKDDDGNITTKMNPLDVEIKLWSDRKSTLMNIDEKTGEAVFTTVDTPTLFVDGGKDESGIIEPCPRKIGMDFEPNKTLKVSHNLFNGFPVKPKKGDISKWKKHMTASFGKKHYNYMMDWFADMYQNPNRKVAHALVVTGEKGTGKNTFEEVLGRMLLSEENYFRTSSTEQLFGKFNRALISNLLIVGQEVSWGGSHKHDSVLKDMITEKTRVLEIKGVDSFLISNHSRMYLTSNSVWVIPASADERRFYVISSKKVHSGKDWADFYKWVNSEGVKEALMYEMLNRDISGFDNINCPATEELSAQKSESLFGVDRFVANALENGYFGRYNEFDTMYIKEGSKLCINKIYNLYGAENDTRKMTLRKFSEQLTKLGFFERTKVDNKTNVVVTDLKEIADVFYNNTGVKVIQNQ